MNSNTFQDNPSTTGDGAVSYKFGSLGQRRPRRAQARRSSTTVPSSTSASQLGSTALTVWLADGTNHPGQANFRRQFERVADGLRELHDSLPDDWEMYIEHKPYEPAFYSTRERRLGIVAAPRAARGRAARAASSTSATTCPTPTSSRS